MNEALCVCIYIFFIYAYLCGRRHAPTEGDFIYIYFIFKGCLHAQGPPQAVVRGAESLEKEVTERNIHWDVGNGNELLPKSRAEFSRHGAPESYWDILGSAGILSCPAWVGREQTWIKYLKTRGHSVGSAGRAGVPVTTPKHVLLSPSTSREHGYISFSGLPPEQDFPRGLDVL